MYNGILPKDKIPKLIQISIKPLNIITSRSNQQYIIYKYCCEVTFK